MKPVRDFLEWIKFEHTLFALPFACLGMLLAAPVVQQRAQARLEFNESEVETIL